MTTWPSSLPRESDAPGRQDRQVPAVRLGRAGSWGLAALLSVGLAVGLWGSRGSSDTQDFWLPWMTHAVTFGPVQGYAADHSDYPPGAGLVLGLSAWIPFARDAATQLWILMYVAWLATVMTVAWMTRSPWMTCTAAVAFAVSAIGIMELDLLVAPFVLLAIWSARRGQLPLAASWLASACLMKWQPLFLVPFAAVYGWKQRQHVSARDRWMSVGGPAALAALVLLVYGVAPIADSLRLAGSHAHLSNFAANLPWIASWVQHPVGAIPFAAGPAWLSAAFRATSMLVFGAILIRYAVSPNGSLTAALRAAGGAYLAYFLLYPGAHENHLFPATLIGLALAWLEAEYVAAAVLMLSFNLNLLAFYGITGAGARFLVGPIDLSVVLAAINAIGLSWIGYFWSQNRPCPQPPIAL